MFFARGNYITVIVDAASVKAVPAPLFPQGDLFIFFCSMLCILTFLLPPKTVIDPAFAVATRFLVYVLGFACK